MLVPVYGPIFTYHFAVPVGGLAANMLDPGFYQPIANAFPSLHTGIAIVDVIAGAVLAVAASLFCPRLFAGWERMRHGAADLAPIAAKSHAAAESG